MSLTDKILGNPAATTLIELISGLIDGVNCQLFRECENLQPFPYLQLPFDCHCQQTVSRPEPVLSTFLGDLLPSLSPGFGE